MEKVFPQMKIGIRMVIVQSQAKFHKTDVKCKAFWRLALKINEKTNVEKYSGVRGDVKQ